MKFYDKGFIYKYQDYIDVQIFSAGTVILNMKIYEDRICKDAFRCQTLKAFNKEFLHESYNDLFLKELFEKNQQNITHKDKEHKILIKIKKD